MQVKSFLLLVVYYNLLYISVSDVNLKGFKNLVILPLYNASLLTTVVTLVFPKLSISAIIRLSVLCFLFTESANLLPNMQASTLPLLALKLVLKTKSKEVGLQLSTFCKQLAPLFLLGLIVNWMTSSSDSIATCNTILGYATLTGVVSYARDNVFIDLMQSREKIGVFHPAIPLASITLLLCYLLKYSFATLVLRGYLAYLFCRKLSAVGFLIPNWTAFMSGTLNIVIFITLLVLAFSAASGLDETTIWIARKGSFEISIFSFLFVCACEFVLQRLPSTIETKTVLGSLKRNF